MVSLCSKLSASRVQFIAINGLLQLGVVHVFLKIFNCFLVTGKTQEYPNPIIEQDYQSRESGSMTAMLEELNLTPLEQRRKENRLCHLYNI